MFYWVIILGIEYIDESKRHTYKTKEKTMEQNYKIEEPELIKKETVINVIFYIYIFFHAFRSTSAIHTTFRREML